MKSQAINPAIISCPHYATQRLQKVRVYTSASPTSWAKPRISKHDYKLEARFKLIG